jgi:type IV secretory pathway VirD2 relaxase
MIASYLIGTDPEAVHGTGKAFAEATFGSGGCGDCWDYLTALRIDTAHPHVHVIVNRRGLDTGRRVETKWDNHLSRLST